MIRVLILLLLSLPLSALAGQIYRYVDENGKVHYTDTPPSGDSEPLSVPDPSTFQPPALPQSPKRNAKAPPAAAPKLSVISPSEGETLRDTVSSLQIVARVSPGLAPGQGLVFYHNGKPLNAAPTRSLSTTATEIYRGEHSFTVALVDAKGHSIASSPAVTIYKKPPIAR